MPITLERFQAAERRLTKHVSRGERPDVIGLLTIRDYADGNLAVPALERLAAVATNPSVHAEFLRDAVVVRVKFEIWDGFEELARAAVRALRPLPRKTSPEVKSLISPGDDSGTRPLLLRAIALAFATYLRKNGRPRQALRLLRRISRTDPILGKHLAETEAGLLWLEANNHPRAVAHLTESLEVPDDPDLVMKHSMKLLWALEERGIASPAVASARRKFQRILFGR